jgi:hypothetical protein
MGAYAGSWGLSLAAGWHGTAMARCENTKTSQKTLIERSVND